MLASLVLCSCAIECNCSCNCSNSTDATVTQKDGVKYYTAKVSNTESSEILEIEDIVKSTEVTENVNTIADVDVDDRTVYVSATGKKYHYDQKCAGKQPTATTLSAAVSNGKTACMKCVE